MNYLLVYLLVLHTNFCFGKTENSRAYSPSTVVFPSFFDNTKVYHALVSDDLKLIEQQLKDIQSISSVNKQAYEGALLMKKSGLLVNRQEKLNVFKQGRKLLEERIKDEPKNCEYRFLRLIIQEHAPDILGYNKNISGDCEFIKAEYKNTSKALMQNIVDYSRISLNLRLL